MLAPYVVGVDSEVALRVLPVLVWADGVAPLAEHGRPAMLDELLDRAASGGELVSDAARGHVRDMLRHGRYKPTGRGKPASEFLLQAALRGEFPQVSGPVDANNAISLASGLPGSVFDADLAGRRLFLRYGRAGESYVFNPSGQSIDLEDLVVVCRDSAGGWEPCGNPVKDSMATKIHSGTRDVVAILYAPRAFGDKAALAWGARFADALEASCRPRDAGFSLIEAATAT
jgi:DNA/RNA-binding domain of Phe-tRNA-synthetase-like protein